MHPQVNHPPAISLPSVPAVTLTAKEAHILTADGELQVMPHSQARQILHKQAVLVCHAPYTRNRLDLEEFYSFDVLELFAFTHPARFTVPTPKGLAQTLDITAPEEAEDLPLTLIEIVQKLLTDLQNDPWKAKANPIDIACTMGMRGKGWGWTPFIYQALGQSYDAQSAQPVKGALSIWKNLPEWAEEAPEPPPGHEGVSEDEAKEQLSKLLGAGSEKREKQMLFAGDMTGAFKPMEEEQEPNLVIAEAGTGIGKTLGYLAPASIWAEKNKGAVWISTYTKNLQRQIDQELSRLYPDADLKDYKVTIRKGRENYLCLLNLEDAAAGAALARHPDHAIAAGIMARWAAATKDGDLTGADFPGWLISLLGARHTLGLADRRGECIYSACDHYHKCFVERSLRKAKRARIVVANHALVMINAAISSPLNQISDPLPTRYVFDEGHHLFSAADSAFASHLTARETQDLRRWILGAESGGSGQMGKTSRARGLKKRAEDLCAEDPEANNLLGQILRAAESLTAQGWSRRLKESDPHGPCEAFLLQIYRQVFTRADGSDGPYSLETPIFPPLEGVQAQAKELQRALKALQFPMVTLSNYLFKKLAEDTGDIDADTRKRMDAVASGLERRAEMTLGAWINMLDALMSSAPPEKEFSDWFEISRIEGRAIDVGYYRHYIDPMKPFAQVMKRTTHGAAITSATLKDDGHWDSALMQTGAPYLTTQIRQSEYSSPFDYAANSKVFIINDVNRNDFRQVAGAYRTLFETTDGGGLGLFTSIQRLKNVYDTISADLEESHIPLYAQHIEDIDAGSLVDMFREDQRACLLGTDAMRDGVDVPGDSLKLLIFDRVPWPRPTILHKARRDALASLYGSNRGYDEMLTRMKLKQAFGRLIRRANDRGVFVMLDSGFPSKLYSAFPEDTEIKKCGLMEARIDIKEFFGS